MMTRAEQEFHREMVSGADRLKREIGYSPIRFNQMVGDHGGVGAAQQLLKGRDTSDGFTTLWEHNRLEMSVEAIVLLPWYRELFTDVERSTAHRRLVDHGFDVVEFLRSAGEHPPSWRPV